MINTGFLSGKTLTQDETLNFEQISNGAGIVHFTLHNRGESTLLIDDFSQEEIKPGDMFIIESPVALLNTDFKVRFKKEAGKSNFVIVRFIVPHQCITENKKQ